MGSYDRVGFSKSVVQNKYCNRHIMIRTQLIKKLHQHLQMNKFYMALSVAQPPIVNNKIIINWIIYFCGLADKRNRMLNNSVSNFPS